MTEKNRLHVIDYKRRWPRSKSHDSRTSGSHLCFKRKAQNSEGRYFWERTTLH